MDMFEQAFNTIAGWYGSVFSDWLYIHFVARTAILLLVIWLIVFLGGQIYKYVLGPLLVLVFYHIFFRAWNYLFVETPMEWIYIHYYSKEKSFLSNKYLALCDKVKLNRLKLDHVRYKGIIIHGHVRRGGHRLIVIGMIAGTLWVAAFGLYYEYAYQMERPVMTQEEPQESNALLAVPAFASAAPEPTPPPTPVPTPEFTYTPPTLSPDEMFWLDANILYLNDIGYDGSNVRDKPDGTDSIVVEIVWGTAVLEYLGEYYEDPNTPTMYWLKVRTAAGTVGYVSNRLLQLEEQF
jgi:hypothetical protein